MADETNNSLFSQDVLDSMEAPHLFNQKHEGPVTVLGKTFNSDEERRAYFREELRKKLPELKKIEGFPIGEDDDIIALSDPPYYTACPNPWLNDFVAEWEEEKKKLGSDDSPVGAPYSFAIKEQKNNPIYVAHSYHTKVPPEVIMNYYLYYTKPGDIVIDSFAGTGMAGVAANMCGDPSQNLRVKFEEKWRIQFSKSVKWGFRNCILGDLSPITSYITYNYTNPIDSANFNKAAKAIYTQLYKELGWLYEFKDSNYGNCRVIYYVWSEVQVCQGCGKEFVYWDQAIDISKDTQLDSYPCPNCGTTISKRNSVKSFSTEIDKVLGKPVSIVKMVPVFISFEDSNGHRHERELTKEERLKYSFDPDTYPATIPISKLEKGDKTIDPFRLGISYLHQFYSKRNLFILARMRELIEAYPCDDRLRAFLRIWFTSSQSRLHMMNRYAVKHHRHVGPLSNTLYVSATPTEISPFYFVESKIKDNNFDIYNVGNVVNQVASATVSSLKDNCVDYIFTDPPFGSNIMYSELNFLWESWLGLRTDNQEEAIVNDTQNKSISSYQDIMLRCFKEYYRILKPGHWITVEFSNTSAAVWNSIQLALQQAGFVVSMVTDLNKGRAGLHGIIGVVSVNQDLAISCYKPTSEIIDTVVHNESTSVWSFVADYLNHLPVHIKLEEATVGMSERSPKILYDRVISYFIEKGLPVPIDATDFQAGLKERFLERDGMFFTPAQVIEYDEKKKLSPEFVPMGLIISSEADGIEWLRVRLRDNPQTYQDIQPNWMQAINGLLKGDILPELSEILEENFIQEADGRWRLPNIQDDVDKDKLRTKSLLKEFKVYVEAASKPHVKIKEARMEALLCGFKHCYMDKDFATIVLVGDKIPSTLLNGDPNLLQFYDIARTRV